MQNGKTVLNGNSVFFLFVLNQGCIEMVVWHGFFSASLMQKVIIRQHKVIKLCKRINFSFFLSIRLRRVQSGIVRINWVQTLFDHVDKMKIRTFTFNRGEKNGISLTYRYTKTGL